MSRITYYIFKGIILSALIDMAVVLFGAAIFLGREFSALPSYRSYILVGMFLVVIALSNLLARTVRYYENV